MKRFEFELSNSLYVCATTPIREKYDLLKLLVHTIKFLINTPISPAPLINPEKKLIVYVDKMSRLLFCVKDKMFTFQFPLQIRCNSASNYITLFYKDCFEIDHIVSSILLAVFEEDNIFDGSLDSVNEKITQEVIDCDLADTDIKLDSLCELVKQLMLFEPGYLRYDCDVDHANGELHPKHHLDVFYSSNSTMKLGLRSSIESGWMLDMLNVLTDCKFVT